MARSNNPARRGLGAQNLDSKGRVNRFVSKRKTRAIARQMAKHNGGGSVY